jgi:hypothetical protein
LRDAFIGGGIRQNGLILFNAASFVFFSASAVAGFVAAPLPWKRYPFRIGGKMNCIVRHLTADARESGSFGELALPKTNLFLHVSWVGRGACLPRFAWRRQVLTEPKKSGGL